VECQNFECDGRTGLNPVYDIQLTSLVVHEYACLLEVMELMGFMSIDPVYGGVMQYRAQVVAQSIQDWMWDEQMGIYNYYYINNNTWRQSVYPVSFMPFLTGIPSVAVAESMVTTYLQSTTVGLALTDNMVSAGGPAKYGIPSVSVNDPLYTAQNYWEGSVWPVTNFILYWCLTFPKYANSAIIQNALSQLLVTNDELWLLEYNLYGHLHEDYNAITGYGCDSETSFSYPYHLSYHSHTRAYHVRHVLALIVSCVCCAGLGVYFSVSLDTQHLQRR
jgi:hypothetical protein